MSAPKWTGPKFTQPLPGSPIASRINQVAADSPPAAVVNANDALAALPPLKLAPGMKFTPASDDPHAASVFALHRKRQGLDGGAS